MGNLIITRPIEKLNSVLIALLFLPTGLNALTVGVFLYAQIILCGYFVAVTGGTHTAYVHCLYVPIIITGMSLGAAYGLVAALISAFIVGPFMPSSLEPLIQQPTINWIFRTFMFTTVGLITGGGITLYKRFSIQKRQLLTDPTTDLLNMRGLKQQWEDITDESLKDSAIIIMEIQHLLDIEQALDSDAMQELLKKITYHLNMLNNHTVLMAHLYNGGFAIIVNNLDKASEFVELCQQHIPRNFTINNVPILVESYFGIAEWAGTDDLTAVIRKARIAVIKAKQTKHIKRTYKQIDDKQFEHRIYIIRDFAQALTNNELTLHYQPKIDLTTGHVYGVEALVRWQHKQFGMISPQDFIPIIERTLLINPFTEWVINQAIQQLTAWRAAGINISVAINFSMMNFEDQRLLELLVSKTNDYKIPPRLIEIELTETAVAYNMKNIANALTLLRSKGFSVAIDDFGTGQSSLQYLCELPVDTLKIDKFFVQSAQVNLASAAIVRTAIILAKELNMMSVAEGIETVEVLQWLVSMGCQSGQGYYIAKPLPANQIEEWIKSYKFTAHTS